MIAGLELPVLAILRMFIEAFEAVLADKRFQLSSPQATRARNLASSIVR